jgi:hypothetical protein
MKITSIILMLLLFAAPSSARQLKNLEKETNTLGNNVTKLKREFVANGTTLTTKEYHELARCEAAFLRKYITYQTLVFLNKQGTDRNVADLQQMVDVAFKCSMIFVDLGETSHERFRRILGWAYTETNFKKNLVSSWKKGQYIKSLNVTITYDSTDYGTWQINDYNDMSLKEELWSLYLSGVINFKIVKVDTVHDLFDIPTNCAFRCLVEAERKRLGLNWKQDKSKAYLQFIENKMADIESKGYYDKKLVEHYYHKEPIKKFVFK